MKSDDTKPTLIEGYTYAAGDYPPEPTKPAVLSAARLAEIREADASTHPLALTFAGLDRRALLAHLDALAAGEVPDGEALGRGLFEHMSVMAWPDGRGKIGGPGWDGLREDSRSYYRGAALALYTRGRTAGRAEGAGSETSAHLIEARNTAQRTAEEAHATIARLQAELAEARGAVIHADFAGGLSVCARPGETTKDVERITCPACLVKLYSVAADDADKMREQVDRLTAEIDAARIEGARVERREWSALLTIVDRITFDAPDDKPNGPGEQAIDDMSKALEVDRWPSNVRSRIADLNGHMATLCDALADDCHDLKAAADALRARGEDRPPCPGAGWEWDAFALQWFQPGAKGKAIAVPNRARGAGGAG